MEKTNIFISETKKQHSHSLKIIYNTHTMRSTQTKTLTKIKEKHYSKSNQHGINNSQIRV